MPERKTMERVQRDRRAGKSPGTQAGEFVREEIEHIREGRHGAASAKQAIAIGLSKARRAGVALKKPGKNQSAATRRKAERDTEIAHGAPKKRAATKRRRAATTAALKRKPRRAASKKALSRQVKSAARRRGPASRSAAARKAARTRARHRA
jgi:hypothetical protein